MGIPKEMLSRVFDLFTQIESAEGRRAGGLGIGLTPVRRLVELHGGTVHVTSEGPGHGSEYVVRLPALPNALPSYLNGHASRFSRIASRSSLPLSGRVCLHTVTQSSSNSISGAPDGSKISAKPHQSLSFPIGTAKKTPATTSTAKSAISKDQQSSAMPLPGQANDHSTLSPKASQKSGPTGR